MDQPSFASLDFAAEKKRTKRDVFLAELAAVMPWDMLGALIEPHYPKILSCCASIACSSGTCVDDARVARGFWRSASGRVQVMCPAYWCGAMTAGPDVVRGSGPNQPGGQLAHVPLRVFPIDGSTVRITPSSPSQLECAPRRDLYLFIGSPLHARRKRRRAIGPSLGKHRPWHRARPVAWPWYWPPSRREVSAAQRCHAERPQRRSSQ